jgi:pimeloyl-ACP methyl ester carboxylesterase
VLSHTDAVAAQQDEEVSLRYPSRGDLAKLDLPVDIVVGDLGQPYFHRIARHLERLIPSAAVHSVPDASHAIHSTRRTRSPPSSHEAQREAFASQNARTASAKPSLAEEPSDEEQTGCADSTRSRNAR